MKKKLLLSDPTHNSTKSGLEANHLQVGGRERRASGKLLQLQSQTNPVPILALLLTHCVISRKWLNLSEPQLPRLRK